MTVKEILCEITNYITLSPIANNHYRKSRQWLYHKINEDVINNVQYKLSDEEIDILISALDGIKDNIYNVIRNLEHFKLEREYLRIPEEDRKLLEKYQEQMSAYGLHQYEERQELIRQVYASQTSPYVIKYADDIVDFNSWHLLNLRNDPIKYDGNYIRTIVAETISDIEDKIATELKKKRRKKKKDNFDEDEDDENNDYDKYNEMLNLRTDALTITCKIYYQLNSLIPSESLQEKINKLPKTITSLGNIEVSQIEKIACDKIRLVNNQNLF